MTPLHIVIQAFGSYLGKTEIDFTALGTAPIFLITGPTGGGKTTILDAMCFALYGRATGGRRSWGSMRCTSAPDELETLVEFTFRLGRDSYRFARGQKLYAARGTGESKTRETHECWKQAGGEWELIQSGSDRRVRECAEQILGLDCEQFSQVIVLPQGDFLRLLLSNSRDKARIFQTLFATGKWERATAALRERAAALERDAGALETERRAILSREEVETPEQLAEREAALAAALEENQKEKEEAEKLLHARNGELSAAKALKARFDEWSLARREDESLGRVAENWTSVRERLELARRAQGIRPCLDHLHTARQERLQRERFLKEAQKRLAAAESEERAAKGALTDAHAYRRRLEELSRETGMLESALHNAARCEEKRGEVDAIRKEAAGWEGRRAEAAKKLETAEQRLTAGEAYISGARAAAAELPALLEEAQRLMQENAAASLAHRLKEGEPCPVCGATAHPRPAVEKSGRLREVETAVGEAKQAAAKLESAQKRLEQRRSEWEEARKELAHCREQLARLRGEESAAAAALEGLLGEPGAQDGLKSLQIRLENARRETREAALAAERLEKRSAAAESAVSAAREAYRAAGEAEKRAAKMENDANARLLTEMETAGIPPEADCEAWILPLEEINRLASDLEKYQMARESARRTKEKLARELAGRTPPDLAALCEKQAVAQERVSAAAARSGSLAQRARSAAASQKRLRELSINGARVMEEFSRAQRLAALLTGKNAMKIPIHQFVLGIMLDDILTQANHFFSILSAGRYSLNRMNRASGGNAYGGLDLQVFDAYGGGARAVETLSGGELFLASLALAFGLSDVVQRYSGGVRLDSIFIDEGFGTLDQDALDTAMRALDQIRSMGRMVGVISHVAELKDRIASQIVVYRSTDGGSAARVVNG